MGKYFYFILFFFLNVLFFNFDFVQAEGLDPVINEIYPCVNSGEVEWIELFNPKEEDLILVGLTIGDGSGAVQSLDKYTIPAKGYLLLKKELDFSFPLNDTGDLIELRQGSLLLDQMVYGSWNDGDISDNLDVPPKGSSLARTPDGQDANSNADFIVQKNITPGSANPLPLPPPAKPMAPTILLPEDGTVFAQGTLINFSWQNLDTQPLNFEILISTQSDLSESLIDEEELNACNHEVGEVPAGQYYWQVIASNGTEETPSLISHFVVEEPTYSRDILVNEVMANPLGDESGGEWIELYNRSDKQVNLKNWYLVDMEGAIKKYKISEDIFIEGNGFVVFTRSKTGISLNNTSDGVRLIQPNDFALDIAPAFSGGQEGQSWAQNTSGKWFWTTTPTPGSENVINKPVENEDMGGDDEIFSLTASSPITIQSGQFKKYQNQYVAIIGKVAATYGNTFYLNDNTGEAKFYIQEKWQIEKPEMRKGDLVEARGLVNLFRETWRILIIKQEDVKILKKSVDNEVKGNKTSAAVKKASAAPLVKSIKENEERPLKQVLAAAEVKDKQDNKFSIQILKAITGLAVIFLIILIIKVKKFPKVKILGGNFGNDNT